MPEVLGAVMARKRVADLTPAALEQRRAHGHEYRAANRDRIREQVRAWRAANPEEARAQSRDQAAHWRTTNPERKREQGRAYTARKKAGKGVP